jgi:putative hydrolase of the HAD superfamily
LKIKGVSFDFWSTLFVLTDEKKTWLVVKERMLKIFSEYGISLEGEKLLDCFREAMAICLDKQENHGLEFDPEEQLQYILARLGIKFNKEMFESLYLAYTTTLLDVPPKLMDGAVQVINELAGLFSLALICNTGRTPGKVIRQLMKRNGIFEQFEVVHFSNELGIAKPNPEIFRKTLAKLNLSAQEVVHIGDNPLTDVWGAKSVGMRAIWFNWRKEEKQVDCDLEIDSLWGLKDKILNLA